MRNPSWLVGALGQAEYFGQYPALQIEYKNLAPEPGPRIPSLPKIRKSTDNSDILTQPTLLQSCTMDSINSPLNGSEELYPGDLALSTFFEDAWQDHSPAKSPVPSCHGRQSWTGLWRGSGACGNQRTTSYKAGRGFLVSSPCITSTPGQSTTLRVSGLHRSL